MYTDINIVTERRKDPGGRRHGRSPSPRSRFSRDPERWSRGRRSPPSPPPPRFRGHPDRFRDPLYPPPRGSAYMSELRDDPYDRFPPEPPFLRPPPPLRSRPPYSPRDFNPPPPPLRERFERGLFEELEREREPHSPPAPPLLLEHERNRPHMEIIVVNRQQR